MKEKIIKFWESVWIPETEENKAGFALSSFRSTIRLFFAATERFKKDEDLIRASSISYSLVVSFIPTLIVGLILAANFINIKDYEELAKEYVRKNAIPMDVSAYFSIVYELLNNTAALTSVGFLFVLFSTTSVLRNLEDAMNKIWHLQKSRPMIQKVAEFVMIMIFGPLLLFVAISTGQKILNEFSSPTLVKIDSNVDREYILGDKRILLVRTSEDLKWKNTGFIKNVDFDFQKEPIVYDPEYNLVLTESELQPLAHRVKKESLSDIKNSKLVDMTFMGESIYIITDSGTLLYSRDNGQYWMARKFQKKQLNILTKAVFTKIHFFNDSEGIIIGKSGLILRTTDAGESWKPLYYKDVDVDLKDIAEIKPNHYLIVGEDLTALISKDRGVSWSKFSPIQNYPSNDREDLYSITVYETDIHICGNSGVIFTSKDEGTTWTKKNLAYRKYDFHDILFINKDQGIIIGDEGNIRYTMDGGEIWKQAESPSDEELKSVFYSRINNQINIVGENYSILTNKDGNQLDKFVIIEKSPFWRLAITAFGRFFLPLFVLWIIFFFIYTIMPYTNVKFKPAALGAITTSIALMFFIIGFQIYISYFSAGKFAIYGTLAAIPLVLLVVNISTIIVLYGCELSYLMQHPDLIFLSYQKRSLEELEKHQIWQGIQVIHRIHSRFLDGKGETTEKHLIKTCKVEPDELYRVLNVFFLNNLIAKTENNGLIPLISAERISLEHLIEILSPNGFDITGYDEKNILVKELKPIFQKYNQSRKEIFQDKYLSDLLENHPSRLLKSKT